jgi:hypothetical protein
MHSAVSEQQVECHASYGAILVCASDVWCVFEA